MCPSSENRPVTDASSCRLPVPGVPGVLWLRDGRQNRAVVDFIDVTAQERIFPAQIPCRGG